MYMAGMIGAELSRVKTLWFFVVLMVPIAVFIHWMKFQLVGEYLPTAPDHLPDYSLGRIDEIAFSGIIWLYYSIITVAVVRFGQVDSPTTTSQS